MFCGLHSRAQVPVDAPDSAMQIPAALQLGLARVGESKSQPPPGGTPPTSRHWPKYSSLIGRHQPGSCSEAGTPASAPSWQGPPVVLAGVIGGPKASPQREYQQWSPIRAND